MCLQNCFCRCNSMSRVLHIFRSASKFLRHRPLGPFRGLLDPIIHHPRPHRFNEPIETSCNATCPLGTFSCSAKRKLGGVGPFPGLPAAEFLSKIYRNLCKRNANSVFLQYFHGFPIGLTCFAACFSTIGMYNLEKNQSKPV